MTRALMACRDVDDRPQLVVAVCGAQRVVRVAENQRSGPARECGVERIQIQHVSTRIILQHRDFHPLAPGDPKEVEKRHVCGNGQHDRTLGSGEEVDRRLPFP